ncbi:globin domain-containing protein [Kitasatospora sp. NPDC088346]|uniref:globin domain-containing protein n=1 Tax=Kitasatospora sp. NPDC088346 TaxID=3364073 RepID=UPI0038213C27
MEITRTSDYDRLLARHHAMRLRRQILAPSTAPGPAGPGAVGDGGGGGGGGGGYEGGCDGGRDQRTILRHLDLVTPFDGLIAQLYDAMFRRRPYMRRLFPASMAFQQEHLARMFTYLIENLHRPDHLTAVLEQLGRDHRKLGVWPAHYGAFEEALREALRGRAGHGWTAQAEQAWLRMLRFAVRAMVGGAESAMTEPPYWHGLVVAHERRASDLAVLYVRTGEEYPYRAGQYASLESPLLPHTWRQYSVACAPRADHVLEFHVRRSGPGGVSEALVDGTGVGDSLRLGPPRGTLTPDGDPRDLLLVAQDTGAAPMKAILEDLSGGRRARGQRVRLYVGAGSRADLYEWDTLAALGAARPWLDLAPVLPVAPAATADLAGALEGRDWSEHSAFVSGPPAVLDAVRARLLASGMPAERIRQDPAAGHGRG